MVSCQVRYDVVWLCLDPEPLGDIPDIPELGAQGWRLVPEYEWMFDCSAAQLIENNFDPAHIAFVHRNTFGTRRTPSSRFPTTSAPGMASRPARRYGWRDATVSRAPPSV
jgi:phenylpropionate dioxygenase-like ring-hydroxylating dioxygenase large terminal subunit